MFKFKLTDISTNSNRHSQMEYAVFPNAENKEGASGALVKIDEAKPGIGGTLVYFATAEINVELKELKPVVAKSSVQRHKLTIWILLL